MCGIIGILPRPGSRQAPSSADILRLLDAAVEAGSNLQSTADALMAVDQLLRGDAGIQALAGNLTLAGDIMSRLSVIDARAEEEERRLDALHADTATLDAQAAVLSRVKDAAWAIRCDRLRTADEVHALAGRNASV